MLERARDHLAVSCLTLLVMMTTGLTLLSPAAVDTRGAIGMSANGNSGCAVMASHRVECWGSNFYGQLGNGTRVDSSTPVLVQGIHRAVAVTTGGFHACALLSTGHIACWGYNFDGQLGDRSTANRRVPVYIIGIRHAKWVSAGYDHTCAILTTGAAECWGYNGSGALGGSGRSPITMRPCR